MAMNFKVFEDKRQVAEYTADIIRKQFNNNPTTVAGFNFSGDQAPVSDELQKYVSKHAVDFSQIHVLDFDNQKSYYDALGVPEGQIHASALGSNTADIIKDKIKTKENKGTFVLAVTSLKQDGNTGINVEHGLMEAREVILVVTGNDKREAVEKLYHESNKNSFPTAGLKSHRMVNVILDKEAAAGLPEDVKEYFTARFA